MSRLMPWIKRVIAIVLIVLLWQAPSFSISGSLTTDEQQEAFYRGSVEAVLQVLPQESSTVQLVSVKISEGPLKGQVIYAQNIYESSMYGSFLVSPGDKVFVYVIMDNGKVTDAYVQDLDRFSGTISTVLIFSLIVLLIAHLKGLDALLGLFLTGLFMWKMSIPMIAHGGNPLVVGILTVIVGTVATITLVMDSLDKIILSSAGTVLGVVSAYVFGLVAVKMTSIHGITSEIFSFFQFSALKNVDALTLFFSAIMIAALGAVMDVAVSIVSAAREIKLQNPNIKFLALFSSLTRIGRDMIGTMVNTLIFAYAGSELGLLVYLYSSGENTAFKYITGEFFVGDVVRALSASAGLVLTIPLTALMASLFYAKHKGAGREKSKHVD
jgi:uncharacterized membrane protein